MNNNPHCQSIDCAFPVIVNRELYPGLTKREYFAAAALQGLLANSYSKPGTQPLSEAPIKVFGESAVRLADALIEALNQKPELPATTGVFSESIADLRNRFIKEYNFEPNTILIGKFVETAFRNELNASYPPSLTQIKGTLNNLRYQGMTIKVLDNEHDSISLALS